MMNMQIKFGVSSQPPKENVDFCEKFFDKTFVPRATKHKPDSSIMQIIINY